MEPSGCQRRTSPTGMSYLAFGSDTSRWCLVAIHGWACQATDFVRMLDKVTETDSSWRAISLDLPGHGQSSIQHYSNGSVETMTDAIIDLICHIHADEIVLMGHSMGMRAAMSIWQRLQESSQPKITGLIFVDGSHYRLRKSLFAFDSGDKRSKNLSRDERVSAMQDAFKRMFSPSTPEDFQTSTLQHVRNMDLDFSDGMRKSFVAFDLDRMDDILDELGRKEVKVMSLQATDVDDQNQRVPLKRGESSAWMRLLQEKVPQAQVFVMEGESSHFPHVDQPQECAGRVLEFLKGL